MMGDVLHKLGYDATNENKFILHDFHKKVLNYKSIAGLSYERLSKFLLEVFVYWAERGIFVRTSKKQDLGIEDQALSKIWDKL